LSPGACPSIGLLRVGDKADFVVVDDLQNLNVRQTYIDGSLTYNEGEILFPNTSAVALNKFNVGIKEANDFKINSEGSKARVIEALDGEIITTELIMDIPNENGFVVSDLNQDVLSIAVVNRYQDHAPAKALIHGFGLQKGAIASCVGHDTHNIIAVGCDAKSIAKAVNLIIDNKGGISAVNASEEYVLPLPFAGIMSGACGKVVGAQYAAIDRFVKDVLESKLTAPYMTLSFMALLVIPDLKLSDKGLFSGKEFVFVDMWI